MMIDQLAMDRDSEAYKALHDILDESAADVLLTEREIDIRAQTRDVVAREIAPRAESLDREKTFAHESVQALAREGLMGLIFPPDLGGTGDTNVAYAVAMEEITAGCPATSLVFMTQMHTAYPIMVAGSDDLARAYIPGILDGSVYGSLGITEPDAGSDVSSLSTTVTASADGKSYLLNGAKTFITTGDRAGVIICFATVDRTAGRDGITAFVVDGNWEGVSHGQPFDKLGMNGSSTAELVFSNVKVPASNMLGTEGHGWDVVMKSVVKSRISAAAQGVGIARAAYARSLAAFTAIYGRRLPDDVQFALANIRGRILQGRLLLYSVARYVDQTQEASTAQIGMMKQSCTDLGFSVAVELAGLLGPFGDLKIVGVERYLRDAKVTQIYDGTNEIQRLLIARDTGSALRSINERN